MIDNAKFSEGDVLLTSLGRHQCRFPVREDRSATGGYYFCAAQTSSERVYCDHHHAIVTAVEPRRARSSFNRNQRRAA